jgi:hypothetical protein
MFSTKKNSILMSLVLIALILLTRTNHFGSNVYLPDATLAVLLFGGLMAMNYRWFGLAMVAAVGMDFYALGFAGVSDYCMSLGYWGLIPTYAMVWGAGRWLAKQKNPFALTGLFATSWLAISMAFVISNAFWYAFSDKVATLSVMEFSQRVAQYYVPYVSYAIMYLGFALVIHAVLKSMAFKSQAA